MRKNFERILTRVLKHEGGFSNHPKDPGGATMQGVTLKTFRKHFGRERTTRDLRHITREQLEYVYKVGYWNKCKCNFLPAGVDYVVFDAAVNSGPRRSAKWLQRSIGVTADGVIGPKTINTMLLVHDDVPVINDMCYRRLMFLKKLKAWKTFGRGWGSRINSVMDGSIRMSRLEEAKDNPDVPPESCGSDPRRLLYALKDAEIRLNMDCAYFSISIYSDGSGDVIGGRDIDNVFCGWNSMDEAVDVISAMTLPST